MKNFSQVCSLYTKNAHWDHWEDTKELNQMWFAKSIFPTVWFGLFHLIQDFPPKILDILASCDQAYIKLRNSHPIKVLPAYILSTEAVIFSEASPTTGHFKKVG